MNKLLMITRISLVVIAVCLACLWALYPQGRFDAWLGVTTTLLAAIELVRQIRPRHTAGVVGDHDVAGFRGLDLSDWRHNLPVRPELVGRDDLVERMVRHLTIGSARLLTLVGEGGIGKTQIAKLLATRLPEEYPERFPDGVHFVELADEDVDNLPDLTAQKAAHIVAQKVASEMRLFEKPGQEQSVEERLATYLHDKRVLLVLDNCEHLLAGCQRLVPSLLQASLQLHILTTSRKSLGLFSYGEQEVPVPGLGTPYAVELFERRVTQRGIIIDMTPQRRQVIEKICISHLDGIPLAIELVAGRVKDLSVEQIAGDRDLLDLLTGGDPSKPLHQRTLKATIEWSYNLLQQKEQRLLRRLSVFSGWALEAAQVVCADRDADEEGIRSGEVLDIQRELVSCSLVKKEGSTRYRLQEMTRQFVQEQTPAQEEQYTRHRLAEYLDGFTRTYSGDVANEKPENHALLGLEYPNLSSALDWCISQPEKDLAELKKRKTELLLNLIRNTSRDIFVWRSSQSRSGNWDERIGYCKAAIEQLTGREWKDLSIDDAKGEVENQIALSFLLRDIGRIYSYRDHEDAERVLRLACGFATMAGDGREIAYTQWHLGEYFYRQGDVEEAKIWFVRSLRWFVDIDRDEAPRAPSRDLLGIRYWLCVIRYKEGKPNAKKRLEMNLEQCREANWDRLVAYHLYLLGDIAIHSSNIDGADAYLRELKAKDLEIFDARYHGWVPLLEARIRRAKGDREGAERSAGQAARLFHDLGMHSEEEEAREFAVELASNLHEPKSA